MADDVILACLVSTNLKRYTFLEAKFLTGRLGGKGGFKGGAHPQPVTLTKLVPKRESVGRMRGSKRPLHHRLRHPALCGFEGGDVGSTERMQGCTEDARRVPIRIANDRVGAGVVADH